MWTMFGIRRASGPPEDQRDSQEGTSTDVERVVKFPGFIVWSSAVFKSSLLRKIFQLKPDNRGGGVVGPSPTIASSSWEKGSCFGWNHQVRSHTPGRPHVPSLRKTPVPDVLDRCLGCPLITQPFTARSLHTRKSCFAYFWALRSRICVCGSGYNGHRVCVVSAGA